MPLRSSTIRRSLTLCAVLACLAAFATSAAAQATPATFDELLGTAAGTTNDMGPIGIVPLTHGFNASLGTTAQHDSSNGWASILTPGIAYRFNNLLSLTASAPIYTYINIDQTKGTKAKPIYNQITRYDVPGDTTLAAILTTTHALLDYSATTSLGLPSGNSSYGLGAGQVTYDLNNHFEKSLGRFTPDIELGIGDSSNLIGARIKKSYTAVGTLAHFQLGTALDLSHNISFEADAYEQLPLATSSLYSTTRKGKKKVTTATGKSLTEDNGFITSLDIPVSGHITLSGFYNRSLRSSDDLAGLSLTFLLKAPPRAE